MATSLPDQGQSQDVHDGLPPKPMFTKQQEWKNTGTADGEIMVFHPTKEEFANFSQYIQHIERQSAHLSSGICKVIPPAGWHPRPSRAPGDYKDVDDFVIESPVKELIEQISPGCYVKNNTVYRKQMRVSDFRRIAESKQYQTPQKDYDMGELERHFWRNLLHHEPIYGADTPGSIYDSDVREFNMNKLGTILDLLKELEITIRGVNTVFMYFGMWKTMFPWHAEDMDLYSINYLHFGEPKFWYAIPSQAAEKFERLAAQRFPDGLQICKAFLRHKLYIISPNVLKTHGIPYGTMVQYPGEFIITFPKGYHMGFNVGYNCAESTNFALERWVDYGKNSLCCYCRKDSVEIDMRPFVKKYRPEEFDGWFEYWYTERPTSYKPKNPEGISEGGPRRRKRKGSQEENDSNGSARSAGSPNGASSEDSLTGIPHSSVSRSICPKRLKKIYKARKPVNDLWASRPVNLFAEKQHNAQCGSLSPHCCVCQYFLARELWTAGTPTEKLPEKSRRYVTDQMFNKDHPMNNIDWTIREDELLQCSNCQMVVHRNCYPCGGTTGTASKCGVVDDDGIKVKEEEKEHWFCERCYGRDDVLIRSTSCSLCELRGGALVEAQQPNGCRITINHEGGRNSNDFVHVICALIHRSTRFMQPRDRRAPFSPPPRKLIPSSNWTTMTEQEFINVDWTVPTPAAEKSSPQQIPSMADGCWSTSTAATTADLIIKEDLAEEENIRTTPPIVSNNNGSDVTISFSAATELVDSGIGESTSFDDEETNLTSPETLTEIIATGTLTSSQQSLFPQTASLLSGSDHNIDNRDGHIQEQQQQSTIGLQSPSGSGANANQQLKQQFLPISTNNSASCSPQLLPVACRDLMVTMRSGSNCSSSGQQLVGYPACYQCEVCGEQTDAEAMIRCEICHSQEEPGTRLRFHITCAPFADITFERRNFPDCAIPVCSFHHGDQGSLEDPDNLADPRQFKLNQRVIVHLEEENNLVAKGRILDITEHLFATVDFLDGTVSSDIFPTDIKNCECRHFGCDNRTHIPGSLVYVDWNDNKLYEAYYRGRTPKKKFIVKLFPPGIRKSITGNNDDNVEIDADSIFRTDDLLPDAVRQLLMKRNSTEPLL